MSKLRCDCGHVIVDQTDFLPYKASLLADEDSEAFWTELSRGLAELLVAVREGRREEWQRAHLSGPPLLELTDEELISDFMASLGLRYMRTSYQCEGCGRLLVEDPRRDNGYLAFVPEGGEPRGSVLRSRMRRRDSRDR
jgi:hypothetical protein